MAKRIVVVRGDCAIGGAVACSLAKNPNYAVELVAADTNDSNVQKVKSTCSNVKTIQNDLKDSVSLQSVLNGAYGCFIVTKSDFSNPGFVDEEIEQGQNIADACSAAEVPNVVFSTQLHSFKITGISCRHLIAKAEIEGYIRQIGLPASFVMVPCLYEDYFNYLKPQSCGRGSYDIVVPMGTTPLNMISVEDIGDAVQVLFDNQDKFISKTMSICGDKLTIREMAAYLSRHLAPTQFRQKQLTTYQFSELPGPFSKDFANMFDFTLRVDQRYNLQETRRLCPKTQSFEEWVKRNVTTLRQYFP